MVFKNAHQIELVHLTMMDRLYTRDGQAIYPIPSMWMSMASDR